MRVTYTYVYTDCVWIMFCCYCIHVFYCKPMFCNYDVQNTHYNIYIYIYHIHCISTQWSPHVHWKCTMHDGNVACIPCPPVHTHNKNAHNLRDCARFVTLYPTTRHAVFVCYDLLRFAYFVSHSCSYASIRDTNVLR